MPEVVVGVAEAVQRGGLTDPVTDRLLEGQRLLAVGQGLLVVAELGVTPAHTVECSGLPDPVSRGPEQMEGLQVVAKRFPVAVLPPKHEGKVAVRAGLAGVVVEIL